MPMKVITETERQKYMCVCVRERHTERNIEFSIQILIQMCGTSILSVEAATSQSQQAERHQNTEHQPITKHTKGREVTAVTRQHGGILVGLVILSN